MFTGIIEDLGIVKKITRESITIQTKLSEIKVSDSIAVNGVCLTVTEVRSQKAEGRSFNADISEETLQRTNLRELSVGDKVNLERALKANSPLSGHIVLGHVETVGKIQAIKQSKNSKTFTVSVPKQITKYIVPKGSIAIDGISLTVVDIKPIASYDHRLTTQLGESKWEKWVTTQSTPLPSGETRLTPRQARQGVEVRDEKWRKSDGENEDRWRRKGDVAGLQFTVAVIPYTLKNTTLGFKKSGDLVNIEPDILAKYAIGNIAAEQSAKSRITYQYLQEKGFI